jgi:hypothetical protein
VSFDSVRNLRRGTPIQALADTCKHTEEKHDSEDYQNDNSNVSHFPNPPILRPEMPMNRSTRTSYDNPKNFASDGQEINDICCIPSPSDPKKIIVIE